MVASGNNRCHQWNWLLGVPDILADAVIVKKNSTPETAVVPEVLTTTSLLKETNIPHPVYILRLKKVRNIDGYSVTYLVFVLDIQYILQ